MSEENVRNAEIGEAELTGVSGGTLDYFAGETEVRHCLCDPCPGSKHPKSCSGSAAELAAYMRQAQRAIRNSWECPFFLGKR